MKWWMFLLILPVVALAGAGGGYWLGNRAAAEKAEDSAGEEKTEPAVAKVSVAPARLGAISDEVSAHGTVIVPASDLQIVSVPFESRVTKVFVTAGQTVANDQPLIEVAPSAASLQILEEARAIRAAAERDLTVVQRRYDQKLATNSDLYAADNALQLAKGRLQSLDQSGAGMPRVLKAESAGMLTKVEAQIGQIVPIGGPLLELSRGDQVEVKLGVEPRDAGALKPGQAVAIQRADAPSGESIEGHIRLISGGIDPATRFVTVFVSLPVDEKLRIDSSVVGKLGVREAKDVLIVPRSAVLPGDDGDFEVFTVADGKAVQHSVRVGIETDEISQIIGEDLKAGDSVVVVGNHELEKGMKVEVEPVASETRPSEPAGTQPASQSQRSAP